MTRLSRKQIRPFVWVAWLGVVTTALNTLVPIAQQASSYDLGEFRDLVLLVHAPATLLPLLALSMLAFDRGPFAALVVAAFTLMEKFIEFGGQALQLFPPAEMFGGAPVREVVEAIWDQAFFVLWFCNTLSATAAGLLMLRVAGPPLNLAALGFAWAAGLLTLIMLLGKEYVGLNLPTPGATLFFIVFTGYRITLALTLARSNLARVDFDGQELNKAMEPRR
jgi:hypothetical protein